MYDLLCIWTPVLDARSLQQKNSFLRSAVNGGTAPERRSPERRGGAYAGLNSRVELLVAGLEESGEGEADAELGAMTMAGDDPIAEAEGEELGEFPELRQVPVHLHGEEIELGFQVPRDAVAEELGESPHHGSRFMGSESHTLEARGFYFRESGD